MSKALKVPKPNFVDFEDVPSSLLVKLVPKDGEPILALKSAIFFNGGTLKGN